MKVNLDKLKAIAVSRSSEELAAHNFRIENADWLLLSAAISLKVRKILRYKGMSQADLAELLTVTPAQVSKLLSGKVNFELKTIAKLQSVLGVPIIEVDLSRKTDDIPEKDVQKLSCKVNSYVKNDDRGQNETVEMPCLLMDYQI